MSERFRSFHGKEKKFAPFDAAAARKLLKRAGSSQHKSISAFTLDSGLTAAAEALACVADEPRPMQLIAPRVAASPCAHRSQVRHDRRSALRVPAARLLCLSTTEPDRRAPFESTLVLRLRAAWPRRVAIRADGLVRSRGSHPRCAAFVSHMPPWCNPSPFQDYRIISPFKEYLALSPSKDYAHGSPNQD